MRLVVAAVLVLGFGARASAAEDKLDDKFLIGTWTIKLVTGKDEDKLKKSIEFKADGTYLSETAGLKVEGTYKLKGTTLILNPKDTKLTLEWKDLSIKDGKIIHPITKTANNELTRVEKKDK